MWYTSTGGMRCKIIREVKDSLPKKVEVQFTDGKVGVYFLCSLVSGTFGYPDVYPNDTFVSKYIGKVTVVEYNSYKKVTVLSEYGRVFTTSSTRLKSGTVFDKECFGLHIANVIDAYKTVSIVVDTTGVQDSNGSIITTCEKCGQKISHKLYNFITKTPECVGCRNIESDNRKRFSNFLNKASLVHNGKFSYDYKSFVNGKGVLVTCPWHGNFTVSKSSHLKGAGCPMCKTGKITAHSDDYTILTVYDKILWLKHSSCGTIFKTTTTNYNNGCSPCPCTLKRGLSFSEFVIAARKKFNNEFKYSDYTAISNYVTIYHTKCGNTFKQEASSHINGNYGKGVGCPHCATYGLNPSRPTYLYIISNEDLQYVKVGITHQEVIGRLRQISKSTRKLGWVFSENYSWKISGKDAIEIEKAIHRELEKYHTRPTEKFDGSGETYIGVPVEDIRKVVEKFLEGVSLVE